MEKECSVAHLISGMQFLGVPLLLRFQFLVISVPLHHVTVFHVHHPHLGGVWQRRAEHAQRKDLLRRRHDDRL